MGGARGALAGLALLVLWGPGPGGVPGGVRGQRGPHHPRGEVISHHHYRPDPQQHAKITQDAQLLQDKEHVREDIGNWISQDAIDAMSSDELQFHYFKIHDLDNNTKLDGLEILGALLHTSHHEHEDEEEDSESESAHGAEKDTMEYYIELTDEVLREDDLDNDGFLSYAEYSIGSKQNQKLASTLPKSQK